FSSKSKATWIFHLTDYYRVHAYYQAVLKVFMVKYYLPVFLLVSIGYAFIFKTIHLSDYLIVLITTILQALLTFQLLIPKHFPFTFSIEEANQQQNTLKAFGAMGMVIPFVLLHYLSSYITYGAVLYGFLLLATTIFVWRWIFYKP